MKGNKILLTLDESNQEIIQGTLAELLKKDKQAILELESNQLEEDEIIGRKVRLSIIDEQQGVFLYEGIVQYFLRHRLHLEQLEFLNRIQRRSDVKVQIDYEDVVELISKDPITCASVHFKDISAGGTCFESDVSLDLEVGDMVSTIFKLCRYPVLLEMKVLRVNETDRQSYVYGCQFVGIGQQVERLIREFVFKLQIERNYKAKKEIEER